jgi:hypothetical protein
MTGGIAAVITQNPQTSLMDCIAIFANLRAGRAPSDGTTGSRTEIILRENLPYARSGGARVIRHRVGPTGSPHPEERGVAAIAVGTLIAERPPHKTVRARLRHTAPTLGV